MSADYDTIQATWGNYRGVLYGKSSLVVYKDGVEILHTGFRNSELQTKDDLLKFLKEMPKFIDVLHRHWDEMMKDDDEDGL